MSPRRFNPDAYSCVLLRLTGRILRIRAFHASDAFSCVPAFRSVCIPFELRLKSKGISNEIPNQRTTKQISPSGAFSTHFSLDKQLAIAVFFIHDERCKRRNHNDLRKLPTHLPEIRNTSQWTSPVSLPELQKDLYRGSQTGHGFDVHPAGKGRPGPPVAA